MPHLDGDGGDGRPQPWLSCGVGEAIGSGKAPAFVMAYSRASGDPCDTRARELLAGVWAAIAPAAGPLPAQSLRHGPGPRAGVVATGAAGLWWSSSVSYSASGPVAAAAVFVQRLSPQTSRPRVTIGIDIEPVGRFVHAGVARLVAARGVKEASLVAGGAVPLLAVVCVKEAVFKADPRQYGRVLADYAWITATAAGDSGWCGVAMAGGDPRERFVVRVTRKQKNWLALAVAERGQLSALDR